MLPDERIVRPEPAPGPLDNPLKGWCPYTIAGAITQPYSMVFLYVSWRDLEPREGEYRFEEWERRAWDVPLAQGKHIIFRVYLDYPALASGVPDWLIAKGVKMTPYTDYQEKSGRGSTSLSPDYEHPALIAGLERLIHALGARYDRHPRIAFLQLGTLGFWGEWHNYPRDELFASNRTQQRVVEAYHAAFPHKKLMARYPGYYIEKQSWIGFHDDMFPEDTGMEEDWNFLSRLRKTGRSGNWQQSVIGGEMVPGGADKWMGTGFDRTQQMIEAAHFSWVGPYCPAQLDNRSSEYIARCRALVRRMGYQFQLTEVRHPDSIRQGNGLPMEIVGRNTGVAPFYYDWALQLALLDEQRRIAATIPLPVDIRTWQPGRFQFQVTPRLSVKPGTYAIAIGIVDPWTKRQSITFANALPVDRGWTLLSHVALYR